MRCIECEHILIKPHPNHAKQGLGRCSKEDFATFYDLGKLRECGIFVAAKQNIIEKRLIWYENSSR